MPVERILEAELPWRHDRRSLCKVDIVKYEVCGECGQDKPVKVGAVLLSAEDWAQARLEGTQDHAAVAMGTQDPVGEAAKLRALEKWREGLGKAVA